MNDFEKRALLIGKRHALLVKKRKELEQKKQEAEKDLPHKNAFPWYSWAYKFYKSRNRFNLLCAANQISKSSTSIRKCIDWSTNVELWPKLWQTRPNLFWYLYPSKDVATVEFEKKWSQFLPKGKMKRDPIYGWNAEYDGKHIKAIHFNSGVSVYFKTYAQNVSTLQSSSVYAIFCDEECPVDMYDELVMRLAATGGYFNMVFTATLGQEFWYHAMECIGLETEVMPDALKIQVSMYDCLTYMDGSPGPWTRDRVDQVKKSCKSKAEIQRRVYGRFVKDSGKKYYAFDPGRHYVEPFQIDPTWSVYTGVDVGSGGAKNHPAAISFVAINPECTKGYVYLGWRGDGVETTAGDILDKYLEMKGAKTPVLQKYDFAAKDFGTISDRIGAGFTKANKDHAIGEEIINTLFENDMIFLFDTPELRKLGTELANVDKNTPKTKAKDDFSDSFRYAVVDIPWDFSEIDTKNRLKNQKTAKITKEMTLEEINISLRRGIDPYGEKEDEHSWEREIEQEIEFWNDEFGG